MSRSKVENPDDDARFDFCYRLRNWEQLQLQAHYQRRRPEPAPPKASFAVREAKWSSLFDVCRLPFLHRSKSYSSLGSQAPILRNKPTAEQSEANELVVPKADVLGAMLLRAVCTGNFELVASLLYAKANVHMEDVFGFGSMHYAARYASPEIVRLLARTGPYVNKTDDSGMSPLCHAVKIGRSDVVHCLLELGAELRFDHLEHCVSTGDSETAEVLLDHWTKENRHLDSLDVLLLTATQTRDRDMIELLLEHGARALARDEAGRTAMSIASGRGDREIVQLLFDYGAEPGWSHVQSKMLSEVARYRHIAMVETLLSKGR
ncbi:hypothetical protein M409DRAFT_25355 [Zasmidium cellare ATCC 36951]|uniref:Uncharacterized protein n=1 Tax=Zasmidium cellare ATCC 36951 TaxID=1080233 RepID=A0A6A6CB99_ZASCE|nr:uncharacterized protein M409DRAFT_25355 [Zasmidium cellare ATCC 36951]KAF2164477.1 hypothetical protein M409DRAFT_25355 [Zasmidium cellare ATCC 36951]